MLTLNSCNLYSKEQASSIKQAFWKAFGQYMSLHTSSEGERINWINYKTGIKHLSFKMQAENGIASITIEMSDPDTGIQQLMFEQFKELYKLLDEYLQEEWRWELQVQNEHFQTVSRITKEMDGVNIFRQEDWPALISFFKPRMIALDEFWSNAQYGFELFK